MKTKLIALFLRGSSMGAKFLLVLALSKYFTVENYGVFSLLITSITFFMFILGLDFYNFSHREIINNKLKQVKLVVNQLYFHLLFYIVLFPLIYVMFLKEVLPFQYFIPFYILLILEHLSQEAFRFLNLFKMFNSANISLFVRTAFWIGLMILLEVFIKVKAITIQTVLNYWIIGSLLSLIYCCYVIYKSKKVALSEIFIKPDFSWLKKGLKISFPFFLGTIAYKVIEYSDRYMIDYFIDKEAVGVYSFFTNYSNILNVIINTIVITLTVPFLLRAVSDNDNKVLTKIITRFKKEILVTTGLVLVGLLIMIKPTLYWVNNTVYDEHLILFIVIVIANVIFNLSLIYHFLLYAFKKDKHILYPTIIAAFLNMLLNIIFIPKFGLLAAALATLISFSAIFVLKRYFWLRLKMKQSIK